MTALHQVLQTPELLTLVFESAASDERQSKALLAVAACVNSTWFKLATSVLWGQVRDESLNVRALATITRARRQRYASKTKHLDFTWNRDATIHSLFKRLKFPMLKRLVLDNQGGMHNQRPCPVAQYLQPSVEILEVHNLDKQFNQGFVDLMSNCPHLRSFWLTSVGTTLSAKELSGIFAAVQNVRSLILKFTNSNLTGDLILQLSRFEKLERLSVSDRLVKPALFEFVKTHNPYPFRAVESLEVTANPATIISAMELFPNLKVLALSLCSSTNTSFLYRLGAMPRLEVLFISTATQARIDTDGLLAIHSLHNLRSLHILFLNEEPPEEVEKFTESEFDSLCSGLPCLQRFHCNLDIFPPSYLSSLERHCRQLSQLHLTRGPCNLQELVNPSAQSSTLDYTMDRGVVRDFSTQQVARLIDNHAPRLKRYMFLRKGFEEQLAREWTKWLGRRRSERSFFAVD